MEIVFTVKSNPCLGITKNKKLVSYFQDILTLHIVMLHSFVVIIERFNSQGTQKISM